MCTVQGAKAATIINQRNHNLGKKREACRNNYITVYKRNTIRGGTQGRFINSNSVC
jgi:hypothetical protein